MLLKLYSLNTWNLIQNLFIWKEEMESSTILLSTTPLHKWPKKLGEEPSETRNPFTSPWWVIPHVRSLRYFVIFSVTSTGCLLWTWVRRTSWTNYPIFEAILLYLRKATIIPTFNLFTYECFWFSISLEQFSFPHTQITCQNSRI